MVITASRTHDFGRQPLIKLAPMLREKGFGAAQLVLPKAFCEIDSYHKVSPEILSTIRDSFAENQVKIHILGCYLDLANPDPDIRKRAVDTFIQCLSYAKELGAGIVGTETAYQRLTKEEKKCWQPYMEDSIKRLVEAAERLEQNMAIEPVYWHPLADLETTAAVFEMVNSQRLKLIFDPANVLEFPEIDQAAYWQQWLNALGDKIEAIHMKDFVEGAGKEYQPVRLGTGVMDYTIIAAWMKKNKPNIVVVREELCPEYVESELQYIRTIWNYQE